MAVEISGVTRDAPGRLMPWMASVCHFSRTKGTLVSDDTAHIEASHRPVMAKPVLAALRVTGDGVYLDATYGRGGHSAGILAALGPDGRLFALDQDPDAVAAGRRRFSADPRFHITQGNFADLESHAGGWGIAGRVDGLLMDLGVSSPQLDDAERGFSFNRDGPLDMRMNPQAGISAADWINRAGEGDIARILKEYGEERFARRIAGAIVAARREAPITRTLQLAELIVRTVPGFEPGKHAATRSFQAIRIHINRELESLRAGLAAAVRVLAPGGRLVVISFHSLEDRLVKRFLRDQSGHAPRPRGLPLPRVSEPALERCGKARHATAGEIESNPRARSAVLRVASKRFADS